MTRDRQHHAYKSRMEREREREKDRKRQMVTHHMLKARDSEEKDNTQKWKGMERDRDMERT